MDADSKNDTSQDQAGTVNQGTNQKLEQQLADIAKQLAESNQRYEQGFQALIDANRAQKSAPQGEDDIDPTYNPKGYRAQILDEADKIAARAVARERELNTTIYNMAQDYPEISTDAALKKAITEAQRSLPESIRETAAGYETAILKAVHKAGLLPKAKRQSVLDDDVSMGSRSGGDSRRSRSTGKVSDETLAVAELLGRDVSDPKVLKGLEAASKRTKWSRYE